MWVCCRFFNGLKSKNMNRDKIVDWLDSQIKNKMVYECMPENEHGYEYVPRHEVVKIVDALIPMIKGELKKCNIPVVVVPKGTLSCGCNDHLTVTFTSEGNYCGNCGKIITTT